MSGFLDFAKYSQKKHRHGEQSATPLVLSTDTPKNDQPI